MAWLSEACAAGAPGLSRRGEAACRAVGLSVRTWQAAHSGKVRLRSMDGPSPSIDRPTSSRKMSASASWRWPMRRSFAVCRQVRIVPALADRGEYLASESTFYRVLRAEGQLQRRGRARPPTRTAPKAHRATAPNQLLALGYYVLGHDRSGSVLLALPHLGCLQP
jgi:putative transposase